MSKFNSKFNPKLKPLSEASFENEQGKDKDTLKFHSSQHSEAVSNAKMYETLNSGNVKFEDGNQDIVTEQEEASNSGEQNNSGDRTE